MPSYGYLIFYESLQVEWDADFIIQSEQWSGVAVVVAEPSCISWPSPHPLGVIIGIRAAPTWSKKLLNFLFN